MNDEFWRSVEQAVCNRVGTGFRGKSATAIGGGCVNAAYRLAGEHETYFVKINQAGLIAMFEAEYVALTEIGETRCIRVPSPVCFGTAEKHAYLVLEHINLQPTNRSTDERLGRQLATLHQTRQKYFGWSQDNTIGSTPQPNPRTEDWISFFGGSRLQHQLETAQSIGLSQRLQRDGETLCANLAAFFSGYTPYPSLLHGDLWGGNYAADDQGQPVIFDPASYYGDREADVAMTALFGGFSPAFYAAYNETCPLDAGYKTRKTLYNLYHILNHLNLFGGGYLSQAETMLEMLLTEITTYR